MSLFNVVQECVVNGLHYVHPTTQPIEVDDEQAAPLVESGCLAPYPARSVIPESIDAVHAAINALTLSPPELEVDPDPPAPKRPRKPRAED